LLSSESHILEPRDELLVVPTCRAPQHTIDVKFEDGMLENPAAVEPRECDGHTCLLQEYTWAILSQFPSERGGSTRQDLAPVRDGVLTLRLRSRGPQAAQDRVDRQVNRPLSAGEARQQRPLSRRERLG